MEEVEEGREGGFEIEGLQERLAAGEEITVQMAIEEASKVERGFECLNTVVVRMVYECNSVKKQKRRTDWNLKVPKWRRRRLPSAQ